MISLKRNSKGMNIDINELYPIFIKYLKNCSSEQELREMFSQRILSSLSLTDEMVSHVNHEYSVLKGRIDSLYGQLILEFKAPGIIPKYSSNKKFLTYTNQVVTHINGLAKDNKSGTDNILGILFDGNTVAYVYILGDKTFVKGPYEIDLFQFKKLLNSIFYGLTAPKALSSKNLISDFGLKAVVCNECIRLLYKNIRESKNKRSLMLFAQWKIYFREICGYEFESKKKNLRRILEVHYGLDDPEIEVLTFAIHTYFSIVLTLLSLKIGEVISKNFEADHWLKTLTVSSDTELKNNLNKVWKNIPFKEIGFNNLIEPTFFSWFIDEQSTEFYEKIRILTQLIADYSSETLRVHDINESDILKDLYQSLSPRQLRQALGEFYTPYWLAEYTLNNLGYAPKPGIKAIDPTCGSGTFLIAAINIYKKNNFTLESNVLCKNIFSDIRGIDLNPLAVAASKINYLIALGEENLTSLQGEETEIPIYLSDSMLAPLEHKYESGDEYIIPTKVANFAIKKSFVNDPKFTISMTTIEDSIKLNDDYDIFKNKLISLVGWTDHDVDSLLKENYETLMRLEKNHLNGIWAGIIKNFFAPTFMEKSDYIIGNPPWVNWENLPESYRDSIKKYWSEYAYNLFRIKGLQARLGSAHDDICVLLTYIVSDIFLKFGGKIGFVLPQTLFKAKGGGDGFRRFEIENNFYFNVESVDDMVNVQPFADTSNKTSVFIATKSKTPNRYPVLYRKWSKNRKYLYQSKDSIETVLNNVSIQNQVAIPIDKDKSSSPWLTGEKSIVQKLHKLVGASSYRARKGVDTSLNQVFWGKIIQSKGNLSQIENCQSSGKSKVRQRKDIWIEKNCLYPVLRGKNFTKWKYEVKLNQILLYDQKSGKPLDKVTANRLFPKAVQYFSTPDYLPLLEKRAIYQKHLNKYPSYACFDIGPYSFKKFKVVWKALASGMQSCVVSEHDGRLIVPDHNVMMIPIDLKDEAYYLSGVLNSSLSTLFITSYVEWFFSTHVLEYFNIPKYNKQDSLHNHISNISIEAHKETNESRLKDLELRLDNAVNKLFDFSN